MNGPMKPDFRERTEVVIFGTGTPAGRLFDIVLLLAIVTSVSVVMLDSVAEYHLRFGKTLHDAEVFFTALFTLEYLIRLWATSRRLHYATSFWGAIDLLSILPTYVAILFPEAAPLLVLRLFRVIRIFRVLQLFSLFGELLEILKVLRSTARSILVFATLVTVMIVVFASLLYVVEGPENGFSSIPMSIYWAVVTITTVGYGDMIPQTTLGRMIASAGMLVGYAIIAVPTAIITAKLWERLNTGRKRAILDWNCPVCAQADHAADALFCKHCGSALDVPDGVRARSTSDGDSPS